MNETDTEDDYSDVLTPPPPTDSGAEFHARRAVTTKMRSSRLGFFLACVAAAFVSALWPTNKNAELELALLACAWGAGKVASAFFLFYFWQTTDASTRVSSPRKIALLDLIPLWNLFWFFKAYAGGARAGVATLELLDDNRARLIAPIRLARVVGVLTIVATLCYAAHLIFCALAIPGLTARAFALLFSLGEATNFYIGYMNSHYIWAYVARVAPLAILVVQLCLRYKLLAALQGIGEYAQSARNTEPHATEAEIAAEREEARRLFADAARKNAEKNF